MPASKEVLTMLFIQTSLTLAGGRITPINISNFNPKGGMLKVARKAFNMGEVWNTVHCHGNVVVKN